MYTQGSSVLNSRQWYSGMISKSLASLMPEDRQYQLKVSKLSDSGVPVMHPCPPISGDRFVPRSVFLLLLLLYLDNKQR